jgi:ADP-ribosylation factor GTPase-activating protein 1
VKTASDGFNRFVEGQDGNSHERRTAPIDESKKDFWDEFSSLAEQKQSSSSIGTAAMGKGGAGKAPPAKGKDEWDDW